jgi:hypothetical protein
MKRTLLYAILPLLPFLVEPSLYGQNTYSEFERGLHLTNPQRARAEGINRRYLDEWQSLKRASISKRIELREFRRNPGENWERIERARNELSEIETSRENLYNQYRAEVSGVLNEEQKGRYDGFCDSEQRRVMRSFGPGRHGR